MAVLGSFQTTVLLMIATLAAYFFAQLYHARMLIYERQKNGLVSHSHSHCQLFKDPPILILGSLWLLVTISSLATCYILSP